MGNIQKNQLASLFPSFLLPFSAFFLYFFPRFSLFHSLFNPKWPVLCLWFCFHPRCPAWHWCCLGSVGYPSLMLSPVQDFLNPCHSSPWLPCPPLSQRSTKSSHSINTFLSLCCSVSSNGLTWSFPDKLGLPHLREKCISKAELIYEDF